MARRVTHSDLAHHRTVVLEGADGVGKSTLAELLVTRHAFTRVHSPRTPDHQDLTSRYRELLARPGKLVLDRSFISELVYGPLYRGRSRLSWDQAHELADLVIARDGLFVYLTAPAHIVQQRLTARDGQTPDLNVITDLADAYQRIFCTLANQVPVLDYDTATDATRSTG